jgi:hypothetical protein
MVTVSWRATAMGGARLGRVVPFVAGIALAAPSAGLSDGIPLSAVPAGANFGYQPVGSTNDETIWVTDSSTAPITFSKNTIPGPGPFSILSDHCSRQTITPGSGAGRGCLITVAYTPSAVNQAGQDQGTLILNDNAAGNPTESLPLAGQACTSCAAKVTAPATAVHPEPEVITFPTEPVGTQSPSQAIEFTNVGAASAVIDRAVLYGDDSRDFVIVSDGCGGYLTISPGSGPYSTPNNYCYVVVAEKPTKTGKLDAGIRLTGSSTGDAPDIVLTNSSGSGAAATSTTTGGATPANPDNPAAGGGNGGKGNGGVIVLHTPKTEKTRCKCVAMTLKVDPTLINGKKLPPTGRNFGIGFTWTMTCNAGVVSGCKGVVNFIPPTILAGSLPAPTNGLHLNLTRMTFTCPGLCAKSRLGRFQVQMSSKDQLNQLFGRELAFVIRFHCVVPGAPVTTFPVRVMVSKTGALSVVPSR